MLGEVLNQDQAPHGTAGAEHLGRTRAYCQHQGRWDPFQSEQEFEFLMNLPMDHTAWTAFEQREREALNAGRGGQATSAGEKSASRCPSATNDCSAPAAAANAKPELDKEQRERDVSGQPQTAEGKLAGYEKAGTSHLQAPYAERPNSAKSVAGKALPNADERAGSEAGSERAGTLWHRT